MWKPVSGARRRRIRFFHVYFIVMTMILALALTGLLAQNAFAKTYVITDGDQVLTYTSYAADPARVLDQAGVALDPFDSYVAASTEDAHTITIRRSADVTVRYRGKIIKTTAQEETAGELLSRLGLEVTGEDVLSHDLSTRVYDGLELQVDHIVTLEQTYAVSIPREVREEQDASLPDGVRQVRLPGEDGEKLFTARVTYVNGEEQSRQVLNEQITRTAKEEVIGVGTGEEAAAVDPYGMPVIGDGYLILPTGELLTYTRTDTVRATAYTHTDVGCDLVTATGTTVHRGTVAVDPRYIPYGTRMFIVANDGSYVYGLAVAEDCGGDIKGDRMDLYLPTFRECIEFGRRRCTIYFLD